MDLVALVVLIGASSETISTQGTPVHMGSGEMAVDGIGAHRDVGGLGWATAIADSHQIIEDNDIEIIVSTCTACHAARPTMSGFSAPPRVLFLRPSPMSNSTSNKCTHSRLHLRRCRLVI